MTIKLRLAAFRRHKSSRVSAKAPKVAAVTADAPVYTDATLGSLSFAPPSNRTGQCQDRLPSLAYTDDEHSAPSLTSSASYASSLTDVDDGLTLWGLPKVMGLLVDEDEYFDCEPQFERVDLAPEADFQPRQAQPAAQPTAQFSAQPIATPAPTHQQRTAKLALAVVYTAILARKSAPARYTQPAAPSVPTWSLFI